MPRMHILCGCDVTAHHGELADSAGEALVGHWWGSAGAVQAQRQEVTTGVH